MAAGGVNNLADWPAGQATNRVERCACAAGQNLSFGAAAMRTLSLSYIFVILGSQAIAGDPAADSLKIPDLLTIGPPAKGFRWKHVADKDEKGVKARYYLASSEKSDTRVLLMVEERCAETDKHKWAAFAAFVNEMGAKLVRDGYQIDKSKSEIPKLDPPVPQRLAFGLMGKNKESEVHIRNVTIFGKNIYSITVWADNAKEADRLIKVAMTFKEIAK
jgi:hypothetical protein